MEAAELKNPLIEEIEEEVKDGEKAFCEICYDDHLIDKFNKIPVCNHGFCSNAL